MIFIKVWPVTNGFDPAHLAASTADGPAAVEHVIVEFAEVWLTPLTAGDGYPEAELAAAEARLGVSKSAKTSFRL